MSPTEIAWIEQSDHPLLQSPIVRVCEAEGMYLITLANGKEFEIRGDYLECVDIREVTGEPD